MSQAAGQLLSTLIDMINTFGVEKSLISFDLGANGLRVRLEFRDVTFRSGRMEGISIDDGLIYLENIDPKLTPKEMLSTATVRIERLLLRLSAGVLNRFLDSPMFRDHVLKDTPVEIRNLAFAFAGERVTIRGEVRKVLTFPFAIDLFPEAVNNRLRIVFENFWAAEMVPLPTWVRKTIMSIAKAKIDGKKSLQGIVAINDDFVVLNPWPKIPIHLESEFVRFGVEGHFLLLELGPSGSRIQLNRDKAAKANAQKATEAPPKAATPAVDSEESSEAALLMPGMPACFPAATEAQEAEENK